MTEPRLDLFTGEDEELDEHGNQLSRLTPYARDHLAQARAALTSPPTERPA